MLHPSPRFANRMGEGRNSHPQNVVLRAIVLRQHTGDLPRRPLKATSVFPIPGLIALRVADWYRLTASGSLALAAQSTSATSQGTNDGREEREDSQAQARANAEAAAEAWLD